LFLDLTKNYTNPIFFAIGFKCYCVHSIENFNHETLLWMPLSNDEFHLHIG